MKKIKEGAVKCQMADLLFDVEVRNNPMPANSEYAKLVIGQLNGSDFFLNACSDRYELVKNASIFPRIEELLGVNGIEYESNYRNWDNVRFYGDLLITDNRYRYDVMNNGDYITPMLRVQHSYNGLTKYRIIFGYFRRFCENGLVIPVKEMQEFNLCLTGKHTASILLSLKKLDDTLKFFANNAKQVTQSITTKYELLGGRMVTNVQDRITEVLNHNKVIVIEQENFNTVDIITNNIFAEANNPQMNYNGKVNDWLIWQGINQYIYDGRNIVAPEKLVDLDSNVLEYMLKHA